MFKFKDERYHCYNQSFYLHFSGKPVALKKKEDSDVGVISNVAVYSLKAKVGKLESENQKLSEKVQQLEREKATLSLLNTETRYSVLDRWLYRQIDRYLETINVSIP